MVVRTRVILAAVALSVTVRVVTRKSVLPPQGGRRPGGLGEFRELCLKDSEALSVRPASPVMLHQ
jgi:hypothetical protein